MPQADRPLPMWVVLAAVLPPTLVGLSHLGISPAVLVGTALGPALALLWHHRTQRTHSTLREG